MDGKKATRWGLSSRSEHRFSYRTLYSTVLSRGASSSSASKQVPRILLKAKVHNRDAQQPASFPCPDTD